MKKVTLIVSMMLGMSIAVFAGDKIVDKANKVEESAECSQLHETRMSCGKNPSVVIARTVIRYDCATGAFLSSTTVATGNTCPKKSSFEDSDDPGPLEP